MTPKIAQFLRDHAPATPCLVLDVDRVEANYHRLKAALPLARVYYAVKANPAAPILERLTGLGSSFDAASWEEIQACLAAGARPEAISYGNTIKKASAIKAAHEAGVSLFAFDSEPELLKIAKNAPGARVYCRILVENKGAEWPLSRKFGCELEMARDLMVQARELGLDPYGISFHVGSQQTSTAAYEGAIARVASNDNGTVSTVITTSSGEMDSIIASTATTVRTAVSSWLIVIDSDDWMLSMSLVTRLSNSPRWRPSK